MFRKAIAAATIIFAASQFTTQASMTDYKVDTSFSGKDKNRVVDIGIMPNDNVCILHSENATSVTIFDSTGKTIKNLVENEALSEGNQPTTMAIDTAGNVYVMFTQFTKKERTFKGKKYPYLAPTGVVTCSIYDINGKKGKTFTLEGLKMAKTARIINDKLAVGDNYGRAITFFDLKTLKETSKIKKGLRICCGIMHFCKNDNDSILMANLGAFKVQQYDLTGKQGTAFGQRGNKLNDFHGCCNPVSVAKLSNGCIVTAEKSPTRVKIYDAEGKNAKEISGITELVKGCSFIPMAADSKGNVYLASQGKGMIKCIPAK